MSSKSNSLYNEVFNGGAQIEFIETIPFQALSDKTVLIVISQNGIEDARENVPMDLLQSLKVAFASSSIRQFLWGKVRCATLPLPRDSSRHNCPSRPDALSKSLINLVQDISSDSCEFIYIYCISNTEFDVYPMSFAISRCFPRVSRKSISPSLLKVRLSFQLLVPCLPNSFANLFQSTCNSIRIAQSLIDLPPNELNPTTFKEIVTSHIIEKDFSNRKQKIQVNVISGVELESRGFGGLSGVGKGSPDPPVLMHLSYNVSSNDSSVALVGKGITYDTGGLSVKNRENMCGMKRDMGGAAGLLGAFLNIVDLLENECYKLKEDFGSIHCVLCLAENSVDAQSYRNDDIIKLYSGLNVEVNNTDAEGRLVLGDGVAYAAKHIPNMSLLIDMATLTGAQGIATGVNHAALVSNCEELEREIVLAGRASGDLIHPLLFCPEFHKPLFKSEIADMKNSVSNRADAQVSCAGWFIYEHLQKSGYNGKWAHIDMCYPVTGNLGERATGYGVALISSFLLDLRSPSSV